METIEVDRKLSALRAGGDSVERALAEMDAKLAAWIAAMRAGQAALQAAARRAGEPDSREASSEPRPASEGDAVPAPAAAEPAPDAAGKSTLEVVATPPVRRSGKMFDGQLPAVGLAALQRKPPPPPPPAKEPKPALSEEDEALLASLDPETASAIRIKRRLANDVKTVRELLEEMRSERPPQEK